MPKVHLPDGRIVNFPDGMQPDQIQAEVAKLSPAQSASPAAQPALEPGAGSAVGRFTAGAWQNLNPMGAIRTIGKAVTDPKGLYNDLVDASANEFTSAKDAAGKGEYGHALFHGLAGVVPIVGPAVTHAADELRAGNWAGGLGEAVGFGLAPKATEGVLRTTSGALRSAAKPIYEMGLNRTPTMRAEAPNAAARGIAEGLIPTPARVQARLSQAEAALTGKVKEYDAANPAAIQPNDIAAHASAQAMKKGRIESRGQRAQAVSEMDARRQGFLAENQQPMTAGQALDMKRAEQQLADPAYHGRTVPSDQTLWHEGLGAGARQQLIDKVKGAEAELGREQELIGLKAGAERATNGPSAMRHMFATGLAGGGFLSGNPLIGLTSAAALEAMKNPHVMGGAGIALDRTGRFAGNQNLIRAAILAQLTGATQGARKPE